MTAMIRPSEFPGWINEQDPFITSVSGFGAGEIRKSDGSAAGIYDLQQQKPGPLNNGDSGVDRCFTHYGTIELGPSAVPPKAHNADT